MKKIVLAIALSIVCLIPFSLQSQINPDCTGYLKIIDDNPQAGDYYEVIIRVETTSPSASDWEYVAQYSYSTSNQAFGPVQVFEVPKPVPVPPNFYTISLYAVKYDVYHTDQGSANNSSLATLDGNDDLSADDVIELKW